VDTGAVMRLLHWLVPIRLVSAYMYTCEIGDNDITAGGMLGTEVNDNDNREKILA
jgi:hypothetical protein